MITFFAKNTKNMKLMWKQINNVINKTQNREKLSCIKVSVYKTNADKISHKFNNYFSTIAQNLNSKTK